jgi:hypothetical protein
VRARPDQGASRVAVVLERPVYSLTVFKLHSGRLTLKGYTKGERVLRFEAIAHNTKELDCGRVIAKVPAIVAQLKAVLDRALDTLHWLDRAFISDDTLERLPTPCRVGTTRVGGVDNGTPRTRTVLAAVMTLALAPQGSTGGDLARKVQEMGGRAMRDDDARRAAYDVKKLRGKNLVAKLDRSRPYQVLADGLRTMAALVVLREQVLKPLLATVAHPLGSDPTRPRQGRKPKHWSALDDHYQTLRITMHALLSDLRVAHP